MTPIWKSIWKIDNQLNKLRHNAERISQLKTYTGKLSRASRISIFPISLAVDLYNLLEPTSVIDPCCGQGIRVAAARLMSIPATGYDISPNTINHCKTNYPEYITDFHIHDSTTRWPANDNSTDLVFTSPPFWFIEKYESVPGQLSSNKYYLDFLSYFERLLREAKRVSRKYVAVCVANFRHRKRYYDFITDTINRCPMNIYDRIVIDRSHTRPTAARVCLQHNHTRVCHDEILIFKKQI